LNTEATRVGEEDRFREDPSMVDIAMTISGLGRKPRRINLKMTTRIPSLVCRHGYHASSNKFMDSDGNTEEEDNDESRQEEELMASGMPAIVCKYNLPIGFLDTPFATKVLDRLPKKD